MKAPCKGFLSAANTVNRANPPTEAFQKNLRFTPKKAFYSKSPTPHGIFVILNLTVVYHLFDISRDPPVKSNTETIVWNRCQAFFKMTATTDGYFFHCTPAVCGPNGMQAFSVLHKLR